MKRPSNRKTGRGDPAPSEKDRIDWLLGFLRRDLAGLRPGARLDLVDDVRRYLREPADALLLHAPPDGYGLGLGRTAPPQPEPNLQALQDELKRGAGILYTGALHWVPPFGKRGLRWRYRVRTDGSVVRQYMSDEVQTLAMVAGADLLAAWRRQLRQCEHCGGWFRQTHGRQRYHDARCSASARQARFTSVHPRNYEQEKERRILTPHGRKRTSKKKEKK